MLHVIHYCTLLQRLRVPLSCYLAQRNTAGFPPLCFASSLLAIVLLTCEASYQLNNFLRCPKANNLQLPALGTTEVLQHRYTSRYSVLKSVDLRLSPPKRSLMKQYQNLLTVENSSLGVESREGAVICLDNVYRFTFTESQ